MQAYSETLAAALKAHFPDQEARVGSGLASYLDLLQRWNRVYNLTAVRDPVEMIYRHFFDSLVVAPYVQGQAVLDCGTGPGLPGIPLALALPKCQFVLLDSNAKKTRFVRQVVMELGLKNVEVVQSRLETFRPPQVFDTILSRALGTLADFYTAAHHLGKIGGQLLAMKGRFNPAEISALPTPVTAKVITLTVPGLQEEQRHLLRILLEN